MAALQLPAPRPLVVLVGSPTPGPAPLRRLLEESGYEPVAVHSGAAVLRLQSERPISAAVVAWALPDQPGLDVCRALRVRDDRSALLMASPHTDEAAVVRAFEAGIDDYVAEPLRAHEVLVRLQTRMTSRRRAGQAGVEDEIRIGAIVIDPVARAACVDGCPVPLGALEARLLLHLAARAGAAVSRDELMEAVYGDAGGSKDRLDLLIRRLRVKLGPGPDRADQLVALPGFGFRLERRRPR